MVEISWRARLRTAKTLYELEELEVTIGRDADNDLQLEARGISRHHAVLKFTHCGRSTAMEEHGLEARAWECEGECLYI